ncbi:MAG: ParA family protein [Clostridiales bacterium]|jgi:chromosome partitioning protein|nr:ParA family protein [Clostridiales bacterium]
MGRIISISNQKGGVGKTTTAINLSSCIAEMGKKVLVIDSDPQGNTSSGFGIFKSDIKKTLYDLMSGDEEPSEVIMNVENIDNLFIIPTDINLSGAEIELINVDGREFILREIVSKIKEDFDFIIIDCPPALNLLTINALVASNAVIVPLQCEYYALEGLAQLMYTIDLVKKKLNTELVVEGVVFTMFDSRTNLSAQVVEEVKKYLDKDIYKSIIPRNVRLSEAPSHGLPINLYDSKSKGAEAYRLLAEEVIFKKN